MDNIKRGPPRRPMPKRPLPPRGRFPPGMPINPRPGARPISTGYYNPRPMPRRPLTGMPSRGPMGKPSDNKGKGSKLKSIFSKKPNKKSPNIFIIGLGILLVIMLIIFVWIKVVNNHNENDESSVVSEENLEMKVSNVLVQDDLLKVTMNFQGNDSFLESIRFVVEGGGKQEVFLEDFSGVEEFFLNLEKFSGAEVEKVSVYPILKDSEGVTYTGDLEDTFYLVESTIDDYSELPIDDYEFGFDGFDYSNQSNNSIIINASDLNNSGINNTNNITNTTFINCTPNYSYECFGYDVYWYDSCDVRGSLKEYCDITDTCISGVCVPDSPSGAVCGNNIKEQAEYCDGSDIGGETCASFGFNSGALKCYPNTCQFNLSGCYNEGPTCTLTSFYYCYAEDVWYYDTCGNPSQLKQNCTSQQTCSGDQCVTTCTTHASSSCYNGDVYWYNSCGGPEDIRYDCTTQQNCTVNQCVDIPSSTPTWQTGMVSWWKFNGNSQDSIGGNHGTTQGGVSYVSSGCKNNGCYDFDGSSGYINVGTFSVSGNKLTIAAWVKWEGSTYPVDPRIIAKAHGTNIVDHIFLLGLDESSVTNAQYRFRFTSETSTISFNAGSATPDNAWHHVVGVYDGSAVNSKIYVDNVLVGTVSASGNLKINSDSVDIGRNPVAHAEEGRYWNGKLDEIMIWNRALNSTEIANLYNYF